MLPRIDEEGGEESGEESGRERAEVDPETAGFPIADEPVARGAHASDATPADASQADSAADSADDAEAADAGRRSRHGRRRAEDHEGGLTVAELLAQMRARKDSGE